MGDTLDILNSGPITAGVGTGLGMLLGKYNDNRQLKQQGRLGQQQMGFNKEMADYNMANSMKMWEATNYKGQMDQMKKAGINPALIYGNSGSGGTTQGAATGAPVSGGQAPQGGNEAMGMMMSSMQMKMMQAQVENTQADTANKKASNPNIPLEGENIKASTAGITQGIENAKAQKILLEIQTGMEKQRAVYNAELIQQQVIRGGEEIQLLVNQNTINEATQEAMISKIKTEAANAIVQGEAMKVGIKMTEEQTRKLGVDMLQRGQEIEISKFKAEYEANNPELGEVGGNMLNSIKAKIEQLGRMGKEYVRPNRVGKQ